MWRTTLGVNVGMGSLSRSSLSKSDEACSGSVKFIWQHNGLVTCKHWFLFCMGDQVSSWYQVID